MSETETHTEGKATPEVVSCPKADAKLPADAARMRKRSAKSWVIFSAIAIVVLAIAIALLVFFSNRDFVSHNMMQGQQGAPSGTLPSASAGPKG